MTYSLRNQLDTLSLPFLWFVPEECEITRIKLDKNGYSIDGVYYGRIATGNLYCVEVYGKDTSEHKWINVRTTHVRFIKKIIREFHPTIKFL